MRTGRPEASLILSMEERRALGLPGPSGPLGPGAGPPRTYRVGLCHRTGQQNRGSPTRATPATIGKWRTRFVRERLAGLFDEPRPGVPRRITDDEIEQVVVRTLESTPRRRDALEHPRDGQSDRSQPRNHQPHLACVRVTAASQ